MNKVYYLNINKKNFGPFSKEDIFSKISNGELNDDSLIYTKGEKAWDFLKNIDYFNEALKGVGKNNIKRWFVHKNGENKGPYSISELLVQIEKGVFDLNDFAWSKGFDKWIPLKSLDGINSTNLNSLEETNVSKIAPNPISEPKESEFVNTKSNNKIILVPELVFGACLMIFALLNKNQLYSLYLFSTASFFLCLYAFTNLIYKRKKKQ